MPGTHPGSEMLKQTSLPDISPSRPAWEGCASPKIVLLCSVGYVMHPGKPERLVVSLGQACSAWELLGLLEGKEQITVKA